MAETQQHCPKCGVVVARVASDKGITVGWDASEAHESTHSE